MTRHALYATPIPPKTSTYSPVSNRDILAEIEEELDKKNFSIKHEKYNIARKGDQVIGTLGIANDQDPEIGFQLAFRNSYDKSMAVGFAAGNIVWICSNGLIAGDIVYMRKHTGSVVEELNGRISMAINQLGSHYEKIARQAEQMKNIEISKTDAAELCGRMFIEEDIVKATQLSIIKREMQEPTFDYHNPGSLWELYNHVTHSLKESHAANYMQQHIKLHNFVEKTYWLE